MTTIVNFFAGPGSGKSTMAAQLFGAMKFNRWDVEYVPEFAKEESWDQNRVSLDDQLYILGQQHHRIYRLIDKVDYIITDCPILLSAQYIDIAFNKYPKQVGWKRSFVEFLIKIHNFHTTKNYFVNRTGRKYNPNGRNQTENEARVFDTQIAALLCRLGVKFKEIFTIEEVLKDFDL